MNVRAERFPLVDSMRAFSALCVLAFHAAFFAGMYTSDSPLRQYIAQSGAAVAIFFTISGFLLYRPFVRARVTDAPVPSVRAYAWRRFLRIVPAYWLALTGVAIWLGLETVVDPAWHIPLFYGFAQIYTAETSIAGLAQAWTLCVELTFYLLLPIWALAMRRVGLRGELLGLAGLWLVSLAWKLYAVSRVDPSAFDSGPWLMPLPTFIDQFAVGMALAVISVHVPRERIERLTHRAWAWWLAAAALYWVMCTRLGLSGVLNENVSPREYLMRHQLQTVVALCLLVPAMFAYGRRDVVRRILGWRVLLYVGLVSYGVYLWHEALIKKLADGMAHWMADTVGLGVDARFLVFFALGALGATAIASASYYAVERPLLRLKRLVPQREQPGEALAEPAPATTIGRS
jgi:peptidoglycan/LPS O-acetylase OafA/YrhL